MDCKEFERLIPGFIADKLDYFQMKRFMEHMDQCDDCREELVIQFLVMEGIQRLEDGRAFDLQKEMNRRLDKTKKSIKIRGNMIRLGIAMEVAAAGIFIWTLMRLFV